MNCLGRLAGSSITLRRTSLRFLFLSALLLVLPAPLLADTVYTYTGNDFSTFSSPTVFTSADSLTGSFTVATPLGANLEVQLQPVSFSFSDGVETFTQANTTASSNLVVFTDASGDILAWDISLISSDSTNVLTSDDNFIDEGFALVNGVAESGFVEHDSGTWSVLETGDPSVAPEPSTLTFMATGALGLVGIMRRRLHL
jgi:hypothetical protein